MTQGKLEKSVASSVSEKKNVRFWYSCFIIRFILNHRCLFNSVKIRENYSPSIPFIVWQSLFKLTSRFMTHYYFSYQNKKLFLRFKFWKTSPILMELIFLFWVIAVGIQIVHTVIVPYICFRRLWTRQVSSKECRLSCSKQRCFRQTWRAV